MGNDDDIDKARDEQARAKRVRDFQDSIAESAGLNTGKRLRFLSEAETPRGREARAQERTRTQNLTVAMQQRFQQLRQRLEELDRTSLQALRRAERELGDVQERAAVDDQGRRMYRTRDGRTAYYEDGTEVAREIQDRTDFRNRPEWETFIDKWNARNEAQEFRELIEEARAQSDRGELSIDQLEDRITNAAKNAPDAVRAQIEPSRVRRSAASAYTLDDPFAHASDITKVFNQVSGGQSEGQQIRNDRAPPQPTEAPRGP